MKLRTVCLACALCLLLPLTACTPKVAGPTTVPTGSPAPTESPASTETLEELLLRVTAEDMGLVSWGGPNEGVTAEELAALVYCVSDVICSDPPEKVIYALAGGDYVDSRLRAHGVNGANNLIVVDGVPIGFVSWEWLELDRLAQYSTAEELIAAVG